MLFPERIPDYQKCVLHKAEILGSDGRRVESAWLGFGTPSAKYIDNVW